MVNNSQRTYSPTSMPSNSTALVDLSYLPIIIGAKRMIHTQQGESTSMLPTQVARTTLTRMQPTSSTHLLSILVDFPRIRSTSSRTETHCPKEQCYCCSPLL